MFRYVCKLVFDFVYVEKQNYFLFDSDYVLKFIFELVFVDMKWVVIFCGEIFRCVFYFLFFGNVNDDNKFIIGGFFGKDINCIWRLWDYESRFNVVLKVNVKKEELEKSSYVELIKRNKLLNFIKSNSFR